MLWEGYTLTNIQKRAQPFRRELFAPHSLTTGSVKLLWVCNYLLLSASLRQCHLPVVGLRRIRRTVGPSWLFWSVRGALEPIHHCHDLAGPDCGTSQPSCPFLDHVCVLVSGFRQKSHCSASLLFILAARVKLTMAVWSTQTLSPSTDKPLHIHGVAPSHAGRPTHLFLGVLHCFRCQKFQNKFEKDFFIIMTLQKKSVSF